MVQILGFPGRNEVKNHNEVPDNTFYRLFGSVEGKGMTLFTNQPCLVPAYCLFKVDLKVQLKERKVWFMRQLSRSSIG